MEILHTDKFFHRNKVNPRKRQISNKHLQNSKSQQVNTARQSNAKERPAPHRRHHCRHYHHHTFIFPFENEPDLETIFMLTTSQVNSSVCLENNINYLDWIDLMLTMVRVNLNCTHVIITEMWSQLVGAWEPVRSKGKQGKAGIKVKDSQYKNELFLKFGKHTLWRIIKNGNLSQVDFYQKETLDDLKTCEDVTQPVGRGLCTNVDIGVRAIFCQGGR